MTALNKTMRTVSSWDINLIDPFAHQARTIFSGEGLASLAESIREKGIIIPLIARQSKHNAQRIELIAGERRLRGGKEAGLTEVPVFIIEATDTEAEEISLLENLGRENLSPIEEARAFKRMLELKDDGGGNLYTCEALGKKVGRHEWEIRRSLKILKAPEAAQAALEGPENERKLSLQTVATIGRLPDPKAREQATKDILAGRGVGSAIASGQPLNQADAMKLIKESYMEKITGFDMKDAKLLPVKTGLVDGVSERIMGGACEDCPFRSGNNTELEVSLQDRATGKRGSGSGVDPNICTKPSCLRAKRDALWDRAKADHVKAGGRVMSDTEAKKELSFDRLTWGSNFAFLTDTPESKVFPGRHDLPEWRELLKGLEPVITLARSSTGKFLKLITIKEAAELVRAKWKEGDKTGALSKDEERAKAARARELKGQKVDKEMCNLGFTWLEQRIAEKGLDLDQWAGLFEIALDGAGSDGMTMMGQWLNIKLPKGAHTSGRSYQQEILKQAHLRATTPNGWLAWIAIAQVACQMKYAGPRAMNFETLVEVLQLDVKKLKAAATEAVDEATKKPAKKGKPEKVAKAKKLVPDGMEAGKDQSGAVVETVYEAADEAEPDAEEAPATARQERKAAPNDEARALAAYLKTGSLKTAAEETKIKLGTLQNWHKRRGWAAKLAEHQQTELKL